jgi:DNA-binding transcriptional regulator YhcF (GntR family)
MLSLTVSPKSDQPLADQIVPASSGRSTIGICGPAAKLPSIRNFADSYNVSRFPRWSRPTTGWSR